MGETRSVAILGATGHIGRGLAASFCAGEDKTALALYGRSPDRLQKLMDALEPQEGRRCALRGFGDFGREHYDTVINCVGAGTPAQVSRLGSEILRLTEQFDNLVLDYLRDHPDTLYINMSSGAVYGKDIGSPVSEKTLLQLDVNHLGSQDLYGIAKICSESKHRALPGRNIVDLRVFGYFSSLVDLDAKFLLTEILSCVRNKTEFVTTSQDITRDYIHPEDLFGLVECCMKRRRINDVFDVYSAQPAKKSEILEHFQRAYGLVCIIRDTLQPVEATGVKACYYSVSRKAAGIGYAPRFSSLECVAVESAKILGGPAAKG